MTSNILVDELPEAVTVSGTRLSIETNFRAYILLELLFNDRKYSGEERTMQALNLVYGEQEIPDLGEAVEAMLWFYKGGKPEPKRGKGRPARIRRIYDYDQDDHYIFAAFYDQYGIDLNAIEYMHWWKFRALFHSLKDDNEIVKIMGYRAIELGKIKDKERRAQMANLQARYKLDEGLTEEEKAERASATLGGLR